MRQGTCLHCEAVFTQVGRGPHRTWCYDCLPPEATQGEQSRRRNHLTAHRRSGIHAGCCGIHRCKDCGNVYEPWCDWNHPGAAGCRCHACYTAYTRRRARKAKPWRTRIRHCPICWRTFEPGRRTYCSLFCRRIGARLGELRELVHLDGEYQPARWWIREGGDPRWTIGPPRFLLDVWVTPTGDVRCPDCTNPMTRHDPTYQCDWCGIRVHFLTG